MILNSCLDSWFRALLWPLFFMWFKTSFELWLCVLRNSWWLFWLLALFWAQATSQCLWSGFAVAGHRDSLFYSPVVASYATSMISRSSGDEMSILWFSEALELNRIECASACQITSVVSDSVTHGCNPPGSSVHGILQARILEWVAMPSSRGSSLSRDRTCVS